MHTLTRSCRGAGLEFIYSQRGRPLLVVDNYLFRKNRGTYWRCIRCTKNRCKCRLILRPDRSPLVVERHSHGPETEKIQFGRKVRLTMSMDTMVAMATDRLQSVGGGGGGGGALAIAGAIAGASAGAIEVAGGVLNEPVQLWLRHLHFDSDQYIAMDELIEEDANG